MAKYRPVRPKVKKPTTRARGSRWSMRSVTLTVPLGPTCTTWPAVVITPRRLERHEN